MRLLLFLTIINGEIKQTQLGITCIASIQYHTQYISINIHSTKYQHNYKIAYFGKTVPPRQRPPKNAKYIFWKKLTYNPSKFSMDNAWTSKPTCAYMYDHGNSHFKQTSYVTMKNPIGRLQLTTSHWTCTNIQSNHV